MNGKSKKQRTIKDIAASVREKLLNLSRQTGREFNSVILQYFQERFFYFERNYYIFAAIFNLLRRMFCSVLKFLFYSLSHRACKISLL